MNERPSRGARPRVAHITNHGYGGPAVPTGGAPDTGGQNVYVNAVVEAMVKLGYHVTVFARGGFPGFGSDRIREGIEPCGEHARYVYVPGGGDAFIRKEDISVALDEELDWLEAFVDAEAEALGRRPWEVYAVVDTHYWDAGLLGLGLVQRWRSRRACELLAQLLEGVVPRDAVARLLAADSRDALGSACAFHLGARLLAGVAAPGGPRRRIPEALRRWCAKRAPGRAEEAVAEALRAFDAAAGGLSPPLAEVAAADAVGEAALGAGGIDMEAALAACDRHVFTPHSLGVLKERNFRDQPLAVRRDLKFRERHDHELAVCRGTRAFAATSAEIAEQLRTRFGVPAERMFFFPPGVDRALFRRYDGAAVDRSLAWLAAATGVEEPRLRRGLLVFETSRMDRSKRKDLLLRAFARVAREFDEAYLIVGGGPANDVFGELRELRDGDPVLAARAFLPGFIPDEALYPLFSIAAVFASASEMEGFGMAAAQAAAAGTPIVASHLIPFAARYAPEDAVIFRAGDEAALAAAIAGLLRSPEERRRRGERLEQRTASLDWVALSAGFMEYLRGRGMGLEDPRDRIDTLEGGAR
jgi:glycosyltransferase involved in cell wall biosynthesis